LRLEQQSQVERSLSVPVDLTAHTVAQQHTVG
jgi:hypothetical protein